MLGLVIRLKLGRGGLELGRGSLGSDVGTQFVWRTIVELVPYAYRVEVLSHCIQVGICELMIVV